MKKNKICIVGLGYIGLPLAVAFIKKYIAVGHDKYKQLSFNTENQIIFDIKYVLKDFNASL